LRLTLDRATEKPYSLPNDLRGMIAHRRQRKPATALQLICWHNSHLESLPPYPKPQPCHKEKRTKKEIKTYFHAYYTTPFGKPTPKG